MCTLRLPRRVVGRIAEHQRASMTDDILTPCIIYLFLLSPPYSPSITRSKVLARPVRDASHASLGQVGQCVGRSSLQARPDTWRRPALWHPGGEHRCAADMSSQKLPEWRTPLFPRVSRMVSAWIDETKTACQLFVSLFSFPLAAARSAAQRNANMRRASVHMRFRDFGRRARVFRGQSREDRQVTSRSFPTQASRCRRPWP